MILESSTIYREADDIPMRWIGAGKEVPFPTDDISAGLLSIRPAVTNVKKSSPIYLSSRVKVPVPEGAVEFKAPLRARA